MVTLLFVIGFVTALVGSVAGLGGGVILVPSLLFLGDHFDSFNWVTPQSTVGISLVVMIFTGMAAAISYIRHKRVDKKIGFFLLAGSVPGGILGAWLNQFLNSNLFSLVFGAIMILVSLLFFLPRSKDKTADSNKPGIKREKELDGETFIYTMPIGRGLVLAFVVGLLSGLLGIGGGSLMVPAMILLFAFPAHIATATSMFMIFFASISSSATHVILGHVEWGHTLSFIPGAYLGGSAGAWLNRKLNGQAVEWLLRILLILMGIRLIWQGIG